MDMLCDELCLASREVNKWDEAEGGQFLRAAATKKRGLGEVERAVRHN